MPLKVIVSGLLVVAGLMTAPLAVGAADEAYSVVPGSSPDDGSAAFEVRAPS